MGIRRLVAYKAVGVQHYVLTDTLLRGRPMLNSAPRLIAYVHAFAILALMGLYDLDIEASFHWLGYIMISFAVSFTGAVVLANRKSD